MELYPDMECTQVREVMSGTKELTDRKEQVSFTYHIKSCADCLKEFTPEDRGRALFSVSCSLE